MAFDVQQVVEAAARAAYEDAMAKKGTPFEPWETLPGYWLRIYRAHTRAALAVIVPAVTEQVRALHKRVHLVFTWNSGLHAEDPCPECDGKAGEWPCGCWGDYDIEYHCLECSSLTEKHRVAWPCPTVRLLDELDAAARGEQ